MGALLSDSYSNVVTHSMQAARPPVENVMEPNNRNAFVACFAEEEEEVRMGHCPSTCFQLLPPCRYQVEQKAMFTSSSVLPFWFNLSFRECVPGNFLLRALATNLRSADSSAAKLRLGAPHPHSPISTRSGTAFDFMSC